MTVTKFSGDYMAKIIPFPSDDWEAKSRELVLSLSNEAIYDDTYALLLDAEEIESRMHKMYLNDNNETRTSFLSGFCMFADAYVIGNEETWTQHKHKSKNSEFFAIYIREDKIPVKEQKKYGCVDLTVKDIAQRLKNESGQVELVINAGDTDSCTLTLLLLRASLDIVDTALTFADNLMKTGLTSESLTDILFERFEFRTVRIELLDGSEIEGEVIETTYGGEPNAYYIVSVNGQEQKVFRKDIALIWEI